MVKQAVQIGTWVFCVGYRGPASQFSYIPPGKYRVIEDNAKADLPFDVVAKTVQRALAIEMLEVDRAEMLLADEKLEGPETMEMVTKEREPEGKDSEKNSAVITYRVSRDPRGPRK